MLDIAPEFGHIYIYILVLFETNLTSLEVSLISSVDPADFTNTILLSISSKIFYVFFKSLAWFQYGLQAFALSTSACAFICSVSRLGSFFLCYIFKL